MSNLDDLVQRAENLNYEVESGQRSLRKDPSIFPKLGKGILYYIFLYFPAAIVVGYVMAKFGLI